MLVSSGYPEEEIRKISPAVQVAGYLPKPYNGAALSNKVAEVLAVH